MEVRSSAFFLALLIVRSAVCIAALSLRSVVAKLQAAILPIAMNAVAIVKLDQPRLNNTNLKEA